VRCDVPYFVPSDGCHVMVQLLVSHTYRCSPCLEPTTVNNMVISDVSVSMEIISNYIETVIPCLACNVGVELTGHISYDNEV